jgi:hypothetical protein
MALAKEGNGEGSGVLSPASDAERQSVREELERLLADPLFRNSRRYPAFLRHVVDETLAGRSGLLKERSLGVDLFDRAPEYDTNTDHIVRTTAAEIRKRMGQYYQAAGREAALRIDLPAGSYVPEFRLVVKEPAATAAGADGIERRRLRRMVWGGVLMLAVLVLPVAVFLGLRSRWSDEAALQRFWRPVIEAPGEITVGITPPVGIETEIPDPMRLATLLELHRSEREHVSVGDAEALALVAGVLGSNHKTFQVRRTPISLTDLRQGAVILLGGFNNEWTIRLTGQLRFRLQGSTDVRWISDERHPEKRDWAFDFSQPPGTVTEDYALISRVSDPTTGRQVLTAAGISKYGTVAAGEFLSSPALLAEMERKAPPGAGGKNRQVVIRTKVIGDHSGAPEIVAVAVW